MSSQAKSVRWPNFLLVGAPRTGTTSAYRYLSEHPEVYLPDKKELHYFTHDFLTENSNGPKDKEFSYCRTLTEYQRFFQGVPSSARAVGDISPSYLFFPQCIPRIKALLGEAVGIIIMLRNPIERAYSNYLHMVRANRETLKFLDALRAEEERLAKGWRNIWLYKRHSLYAEKVQRYLDEFGSSRVKVILYDDFSQNTLKTIQDVYRFLGVTAEFVPRNIDIIYAQSGSPKKRSVAWPHTIKSCVKMLFPQKTRKFLRAVQESHRGHDTSSQRLEDPQAIAFLRQYFKDDIHQLEKILHLDLTMWK